MSKKSIFRFVVIGDTHVNPTDESGASPYKSQLHSNERLRHTIAVINKLDPAFVLHVGDMVHPIPETEGYPVAARRFREIVHALRAPIHLVPGNHDVGDKNADYVPAGIIREEFLGMYRENFGEHYYSFDWMGCRFIIINTSLINSGMAEEVLQQKWLDRQLTENGARRCMLFMHYPPYVAVDSEHGHYDNIDEPGRGLFLKSINGRVECVFTGHVHNFFFNRYGSTNFYLMPSTAFVRCDYSAIFQTGQSRSNERGRDDVHKLGLMVVDVYEDRVVPQFIRTYATTESGAGAIAQRDWPLLPPQAGGMSSLGIDLRESWSDTHRLPYSSMLDEFRRKQARNDYIVLAMWEMGIRNLRVPLDDLLVEESRLRMQAMAASGLRFTVFSFGVPDVAACVTLRNHAAIVTGVEVILKWPIHGDATARSLSDLRKLTGIPLSTSRFWNAAGASRGGTVVKLQVDHGFTNKDDVTKYIQPLRGVGLDRLVFRVSRDTDARDGIEWAVAAAKSVGVGAQVHVRLADDGASVEQMDDWANACRVAEAALCAHFYNGHQVFIDTLSDVDRGYFPRTGLIDGTSNPRVAGRILRNLHGALSEVATLERLEWAIQGDALVGLGVAPQELMMLVLPASESSPWTVQLPPFDQNFTTARIINLGTGTERLVPVRSPDRASLVAGIGATVVTCA